MTMLSQQVNNNSNNCNNNSNNNNKSREIELFNIQLLHAMH